MYLLNEDGKKALSLYKSNKICEEIGLNKSYFSNVLNGRPILEKKIAYCITKFLNESKNITDFFDYVGK